LEAEFIPHSIKLVPVCFSLAGATLAMIFYSSAQRQLFKFKVSLVGRRLYTFLNRKWFFDKVYNEYITQNMLHFGYHTSYKLIDRGVFEFLGPLGLSRMVTKRGDTLAGLQTGFLYHYAFVMLLGVTFLIAVLGLWDVISSYVDGRLFFILLIAAIASASFFKQQEASS
jgi:NADH-ubiquinone oxidoreductase chain 5